MSAQTDWVDDPVLSFGKHRGDPLSAVPRYYLRWMLSTLETEEKSHDGARRWTRKHEAAIREAAGLRSLDDLAEGDHTPDQTAALEGLSTWLDDPRRKTARLEGGAGTGKTFVTRDLCLRALRAGWKVRAMATSKRATEVLERRLDDLGIETQTIARSLAMERVWDAEDELYLPGANTDLMIALLLANRHLMVVDECSMVDPAVADLLLSAIHFNPGKILLVGDAAQLPPVRSAEPSRLVAVEPSWAIREPVRFAHGSPLHWLEQCARHRPWEIERIRGEGIEHHPDRESMLDQYVSDYRHQPEEDLRILSYTRREAATANAAVRERLFGRHAQPVEEDESILVQKTVDVGGRRHYSGARYHLEGLRIGRVDGISSYIARIGGHDIPILFQLSETRADPGHVGAAEWDAELRRVKEACKRSGRWADYHEWRQQWLPVGYAYASTIHKAQGESIDRSYFTPRLVRRGPEAAQLLYVAATRARKHVHLEVAG